MTQEQIANYIYRRLGRIHNLIRAVLDLSYGLDCAVPSCVKEFLLHVRGGVMRLQCTFCSNGAYKPIVLNFVIRVDYPYPEHNGVQNVYLPTEWWGAEHHIDSLVGSRVLHSAVSILESQPRAFSRLAVYLDDVEGWLLKRYLRLRESARS